MKKIVKALATGVALLTLASCTTGAPQKININEALNTPVAKKVIDPSIKLYFGQDAPGKLIQQGVTARRSANAVFKSNFNTCTRAFINAIIALQSRAKALGATKITNIQSNFSSGIPDTPGTFTCGPGNVVTGVALKGDMKE